jgi:hypothetical protein
LRLVADVTSKSNCSGRTHGARRFGSLQCAVAILVQDGNPITTLGAKQGGGSADTTAAAGNDDEPIGCWHHS